MRMLRLAVRTTALTVLGFICAGTTASAATAASSTPASTPNQFFGAATGFGPTLAAAEQSAHTQLTDNAKFQCGSIRVIGDGQLSDGSWWASEEGWCIAN